MNHTKGEGGQTDEGEVSPNEHKHDEQREFLFDNPEFYQITSFQIDLTMRSAVKYMRSDVMYVGAKGL